MSPEERIDELMERCMKLSWDKTRLIGKLERIESLLRYSDISIKYFEMVMKIIEEEI